LKPTAKFLLPLRGEQDRLALSGREKSIWYENNA
jgi:hypothetical protein